MSAMDELTKSRIQANVFEIALSELVCQYRKDFQPLWSIESWAKFLTMIAVRCGVPVETESFELFAEALGPSLTTRMRRLFFERTLDSLSLKIMADPAEDQVLIMSLDGVDSITFQTAIQALKETQLLSKIDSKQSNWKNLDTVISIPWQIDIKKSSD